jgi:hypothetical protein
LHPTPTGIVGQASERRSQAENRKLALFRLRLRLAVEHRQPINDNDEPGALWRSRCQKKQVRINPKHANFPALLAVALDVLAAHDYDPRAAADRLDCTATQLVNLLRQERPALAMVNAQRRQRGQHPYR